MIDLAAGLIVSFLVSSALYWTLRGIIKNVNKIEGEEDTNIDSTLSVDSVTSTKGPLEHLGTPCKCGCDYWINLESHKGCYECSWCGHIRQIEYEACDTASVHIKTGPVLAHSTLPLMCSACGNWHTEDGKGTTCQHSGKIQYDSSGATCEKWEIRKFNTPGGDGGDNVGSCYIKQGTLPE